MKRRLAVFAAICALVTALALWYSFRPRFRHLANVSLYQDVSWSKDSKALFYRASDNLRKLHRYDVRTGKQQEYAIPETEAFDISPDQKTIVIVGAGGQPGISTYDLVTGKTQVVYRSHYGCSLYFWLATNLILFSDTETIETDGKWYNKVRWRIYTIRPDGTGKTMVANYIHGSVRSACPDGSGFVYYKGMAAHFVDLATKKDTLINPKFPNGALKKIGVWRVSRHSVVYGVFDYADRVESTERLDLQTGKVQSIKPIPQEELEAHFSPDRRWQYKVVKEGLHSPNELYVLTR